MIIPKFIFKMALIYLSFLSKSMLLLNVRKLFNYHVNYFIISAANTQFFIDIKYQYFHSGSKF